jgi:prenyltransferase beta subunit
MFASSLPARHMRRTLGRSAGMIDTEARRHIADFVRKRRCSDGGFHGRDHGKSDLYYTAFAAAVLGGLKQWQGLGGLPRYLRKVMKRGKLDFVHHVCLIRLHAHVFPLKSLKPLWAQLESFRSADGGYHHAQSNAAQGSAYGAFMAWLAYAEGRRVPPDVDKLVRSLEALHCQDGGYANEANMERGNANATAAALLVRHWSGQPVSKEETDWLLSCAHPQGGFRAAPETPLPDLLSTATAVYALESMGIPLDHVRAGCLTLADLLWQDSGGFSGHPADECADCEYTFYALLTLGSLADIR